MSGPVVKRRRAGLEVGPARIDWAFAIAWIGLVMISAGAAASFVFWLHDMIRGHG